MCHFQCHKQRFSKLNSSQNGTALFVTFHWLSWAEGPDFVPGKQGLVFSVRLLSGRKRAFLGLVPRPHTSQRPRPPDYGRAFAAPPLPVPRAGLWARFIGPAPPTPAPRPPRAPRPLGVLPAETRESLGPGAGGLVAGLRRLGRCLSPLCRPLSEESFPRRLGDAEEPAAEGPLRERASSRTRHGAGEWRGLGPQPRRARQAGEAAALLALVKTDLRGGCREGSGQGRGLPSLGGRGVVSNLRSSVSALQSAGEQLVPARGSGVSYPLPD